MKRIHRNQLKAAAEGIMAIAMALALCALVTLLSSCHSTKHVTRAEKEENNTSAVAHHEYTAHDWQQSWRTCALELDSLELWLPAAYVDAPTVTADSTAAVSASLSSPYAKGCVLLKAKRATLATSTTSAHTSSKTEQRVDTIHQQSTAALDVREDSDRVAVTKPPDATWIAIVLICVCAAVWLAWRKIK